jgi:hypothetical protein
MNKLLTESFVFSGQQLLLQNSSQVVSLDVQTGQTSLLSGVNLSGLVRTFASKDSIYLTFANGTVMNCTLLYDECAYFFALQ